MDTLRIVYDFQKLFKLESQQRQDLAAWKLFQEIPFLETQPCQERLGVVIWWNDYKET